MHPGETNVLGFLRKSEYISKDHYYPKGKRKNHKMLPFSLNNTDKAVSTSGLFNPIAFDFLISHRTARSPAF
jgi:hypothetical protein